MSFYYTAVFASTLVAAPAMNNCSDPVLSTRDYCNYTLPIEARVEDLLGMLTMEEKTGKILEVCAMQALADDNILWSICMCTWILPWLSFTTCFGDHSFTSPH